MSFSFDFKRKTVSSDTMELLKKGVYPPEFDEEFKDYIRDRDGHKCAGCGKTEQENGRALDVHHINYTKYTVGVNCISLCRECHDKAHHYPTWEKRAEMTRYLYRKSCAREGVVTREDFIEAWRRPE